MILNTVYEISLFFYQLDAQILYFNTFIIFLYMFRALLCSSVQHTGYERMRVLS